MKKVFLASYGLGGLKDFVKPLEKVNVAFVPTAADTYENKGFVQRDRDCLAEFGFNFREVDIKNKTKEELYKDFQNVQMIHVAGGNSFYLLEKMRESGFDEVIKDLMDKGVIYSGSSAGAAVAGIDIKPIAPLDNPEDAPNLESTKGLGLVDFVVLPHYGNEKYADKFQKIMEEYGEEYKLLTITDEQAIIVEDSNYKIINSKK